MSTAIDDKSFQQDGVYFNIRNEVFKQMVEALSNIQKAGLIHRDIKPGNIIFRVDNKENFKSRSADYRFRYK